MRSMLRDVLSVWVLVAVLLTAAAQGQGVITPRIINGTPTADFESVGIVGTDELGGICTGTLIGPRHVLTAAHCAEMVLRPTGGTFELNGQVHKTSRIYIHRNYNPTTLANDIAIFELGASVEGVTPSPIYRDTPQVGQKLTLVGFGAGGNGDTGQDGTFGVKRVGTTTIDAVEKTLILWRFDNNSESNTAYGDSGSPAFVEVDGEFYVAGVTSGGSEADSAIGDVAFDTRVDAFANWIDSIVIVDDGTVDDGDPAPCRPGHGKRPGHGSHPGGDKTWGTKPHPGPNKNPSHGAYADSGKHGEEKPHSQGPGHSWDGSASDSDCRSDSTSTSSDRRGQHDTAAVAGRQPVKGFGPTKDTAGVGKGPGDRARGFDSVVRGFDGRRRN